MIITEYMENGSLDAFLRVRVYFVINPQMFLTLCIHYVWLYSQTLNGAKEEDNDVIIRLLNNPWVMRVVFDLFLFRGP